MTGETARRVVIDTCILINFLNVGRLDLLEELEGLEFIVTEHVAAELEQPEQRARVETAIEEGHIEKIAVKQNPALEIFGDLTDHVGDGEAACIALAEDRGWEVATDEQRRAKAEAKARLGGNDPLTTPDLLIKAIRQGLVSVDEADRLKDDLEENHRFKMSFDSFSEYVRRDEGT